MKVLKAEQWTELMGMAKTMGYILRPGPEPNSFAMIRPDDTQAFVARAGEDQHTFDAVIAVAKRAGVWRNR